MDPGFGFLRYKYLLYSIFVIRKIPAKITIDYSEFIYSNKEKVNSVQNEGIDNKQKVAHSKFLKDCAVEENLSHNPANKRC